jgi:release factor glutamine methyltransferase
LEKPADAAIPRDSGIVAMTKVLRAVTSPIRSIVDIGTGSGCIAVTLACERPDCRILATDISEEALSVACANAKRYSVDDHIDFRHGSLLDPIADYREPFLLISNPPYVPARRPLPKDIVKFEPSVALFAGGDGLDVLRPLAMAARKHPFCYGLIMECEEQQIDPLEQLLSTTGSEGLGVVP